MVGSYREVIGEGGVRDVRRIEYTISDVTGRVVIKR